jgi:hypothetical protein
MFMISAQKDKRRPSKALLRETVLEVACPRGVGELIKRKDAETQRRILSYLVNVEIVKLRKFNAKRSSGADPPTSGNNTSLYRF